MLLFVAIAMVARHVVRPLARVIGWPLERLGGTPGRLARENAGRNPARTANTAAALMIGLGLVVFVAVFAQGLKASFTDTFDKAVVADVVAMDMTGAQTLPADGVAAMRAVPGVQTVAGATFAQAKVAGRGTDLPQRHRRGQWSRRVALRLARRRERRAPRRARRPRSGGRRAVREAATTSTSATPSR